MYRAALYHHPPCLCASEENPVPLCQCLPISAVIPPWPYLLFTEIAKR